MGAFSLLHWLISAVVVASLGAPIAIVVWLISDRDRARVRASVADERDR